MTILDSAEWLRQLRNYSGSGDWLDEANSHDAQFGSTSGADANDPLFKPDTGTQYIWMPSNGSSNRIDIPDHTDFDFTGDIDIIVRLSLDDTTKDHGFINKWVTPPRKEWAFEINDPANIDLAYSTDGTTTTVKAATASLASVGIVDDTICWLRVTHDVDDGAGGSDVTFYYSLDDTNTESEVSWTQLGDVVHTASTAARVLSVEPVRFASGSSVGGTFPPQGGFYRGVVKDGIDGTIVLDINVSVATEPYATFVEGTGKTCTITRSTSGLMSTVIDRPWALLTTNDYWEIPDDANLDFAGADDFTVMVMFRTNTVAAGSDVLLSKKDNLTTAAGYALVRNTATGQGIIADGTLDDDDTVATVAIHTLHTLAMVRNTTDDDIEVFLDGVPSGSATTDSTTATLANALVQRLGATSGATAANFFEGVIGADAGWRSALTDAEVLEAHDRLTTLGSLPPARRQLVGMIQR